MALVSEKYGEDTLIAVLMVIAGYILAAIAAGLFFNAAWLTLMAIALPLTVIGTMGIIVESNKREKESKT